MDKAFKLIRGWEKRNWHSLFAAGLCLDKQNLVNSLKINRIHHRESQLLSPAWSFHKQWVQTTPILANQILKGGCYHAEWNAKPSELINSGSTLYLIKEQDDRLAEHDVSLLIPEGGTVLLTWLTENWSQTITDSSLIWVCLFFSCSKTES